MSNEAFRRIGSQLNSNYSFCPNTGIEDVDVAICLRKLQVYPNKSIDKSGRERFHVFNVQTYLTGKIPAWIHDYAANTVKKVNLYKAR